jgi:L-threonylcarbamoyladenylate synthase
MEIVPPTPESIARAARILEAGGVVAYPEEAVYGLAADPFNPAALDKLFAIKRRDPEKPVLLVVSSLDQLSLLVADLSPRAAALAAEFWPGPLSLLLLPLEATPEAIAGADGRVCIRVTASPVATALCEAFGRAITSTSANLSGRPPATRAGEVPRQGVSLCLDGGDLPPGPVSTVLDPETGVILREGAIRRSAIERALSRGSSGP